MFPTLDPSYTDPSTRTLLTLHDPNEDLVNQSNLCNVFLDRGVWRSGYGADPGVRPSHAGGARALLKERWSSAKVAI